MRTELKYGLIIGLLSAAWVMGEYAAGLHTDLIEYHPIVTWFGMLIPIIGIVLALKEKRALQGKSLTYGQGVLTGFIVSVITALIGSLFFYIYIEIINPDFFPAMIAGARDQAETAGLDADMARKNAEMYFNMKSYLMQTFFGSIIFGLVVSLIAAAILRRDPVKPKDDLEAGANFSAIK